jgi:hypothetical protein
VGGKAITLFMWGFQGLFRRSLEVDLQQSLEALGAKTVTPTVILIGVLKDGGSGFPLCIEPEDGPMVPADFDDLSRRADEFYDRDPERQVRISTAAEWIHERREQQFRDRAYGRAIGEVLEAKLQLRFFVGSPTLVNEHFVYTAVGLPTWVLDDTPHLTSEVAAGRYPVTRSLVQGVIDTILRLSTRELRQPYAGADLDLDIDAADVAKAAAESMIASVSMLAGDVPSGLFDGMNRLATTRYERRVGVGSLLLAEPGSQYVERSVTLRDPVRISETRALRKLLETSSRDGESLLTDGHSIYGLGHLRPDYPQESESVFKLLVTGDGTWELIHAAVTLATVQYGAPQVPQQPLRRDRLIDVCHRVLGEYDTEALCDLADAARKAEHGTMLVISTQAEAEAARLESQAFPVQPTRLADSFVEKVTEIDGAVLVDPFGKCHAIGVILDGTATTQGDRSRGARYNSAVKYLASVEATPTVILLVSEDGMINLLPDLPPRIRRGERDAMLDELRSAAEKVPPDGEQFYKAYRQIQEHSSYFSQEQIAEINTLMDDHWKRRIAQGGPNTIRVIEPELEHDPNMSDEYLIDD